MADPFSLGTIGLVTSLAGSTIAAGGQLAGGAMAGQAGTAQKQASEFEATQLDQNATTAIAAGQRQMFDTQTKTRLAVSSSRARAGASGVDPGTGSALENEGELSERGSYQALMDLWNGENTATGLNNKATATRYSGDLAEWEGKTKEKLSYLGAAGTLASGVGGGITNFAKLNFPTKSGPASA